MRNITAYLAVCVVAASVCLAAPGAGTEYHMSAQDFAAKFGAKKEEIQHAPKAHLAPIPPFPFKMREAKISGWSDYLVRVDGKGSVSSVDLIGYSRKDFGNGEKSLKSWRFPATKKNEVYLLRLVYRYSASFLAVEQE